MSRFIAPWSPIDNLSARRHQELVDGLNGLSIISPTGRLDIIGTPGGRGIVDNSRLIPVVCVFVRIDSADSRSGNYLGSIGFPKGTIDRSTLNNIVDVFDYPNAGNVHLLNDPELGRTPILHRAPVGGVTGRFAYLLPTRDQSDGKMIADTNINSALRWARLRSDGTCIEVTKDDNDSPTYECAITTKGCTATSTAALLAEMPD